MSETLDLVGGLAPVTDDEVADITREVWSTFLGLDLEPLPEGLVDLGGPADGPAMVGVVGISGAWQGAVAVECGLDHARAAAEAMFAADPGTLSAEEVADAWGELANMVGGNVKSLLPAPSALSVPSVTGGTGSRVLVPGARAVQRVHLAGPGAAVRVSVWQA